MRLLDEAESVVRQLERPELPERPLAIERAAHHAAHELHGFAFPAGLRQARVAHVKSNIEVRVVDPDGAPLVRGHPGELLPKPRHEVQPALDVRVQLLLGQPRRSRRSRATPRACATREIPRTGTRRLARTAVRKFGIVKPSRSEAARSSSRRPLPGRAERGRSIARFESCGRSVVVAAGAAGGVWPSVRQPVVSAPPRRRPWRSSPFPEPCSPLLVPSHSGRFLARASAAFASSSALRILVVGVFLGGGDSARPLRRRSGAHLVEGRRATGGAADADVEVVASAATCDRGDADDRRE